MELRNLKITERFLIDESDYKIYVTQLQYCLYRSEVICVYTGVSVFKTSVFVTLKETLDVTKEYLDMKKEA